MSNTVLTSTFKPSVYDLFLKMELSPAVESEKLALAWLEKHGKLFCGYVNGSWLQKEKEMNHHKICDVFSGKHLCDVYVPVDNKLLVSAAENSSAGFKTWSSMTPMSRSRILYNIAQTLEKYLKLFITVEAISSGRQFSTVKDDVPNLIESFNYYACCTAQLEKDWYPTGPVCVVPDEFNNPCLNFNLRISSLLASGNSVLLLPDFKSSLSSFLLAEICSESGLPDGVLNVIPINQAIIGYIGESLNFSKLVFSGSSEKSILYSKLCAENHIPCDIFIHRRPVVIVYEMAHFRSAANAILQALFSQDTRSKSSGCKVMIQESIIENFLKVLTDCFSNILIGQNMSSTDMSCIVTEEQKKILTECLEEVEKNQGKKTVFSDNKTRTYTHMMPTIISEVSSNFKLAYEELGGPIIVIVPFRTVKESINHFNCDNKGSPVSIWTSEVAVAMEVVLKLKTGIIWINSKNVYDPKIPYTGVYFSGNSVEGGKEALFHHSVVTVSEKSIPELKQNYSDWFSSSNSFEKPESSIVGVNESVKEYKLFIGGSMVRSSNGTVKYDENVFIPSATESDVHNAVSNAASAQPKWESYTDLQKSKILFAIIDKLKKSKKEYVTELQKVLKNPTDECEKEFDLALDLLFSFATLDDKFCESTKKIKETSLVLQNRCPLGVVGIQCPDGKPLLSLILLVFSAIINGNAVVAISSTLYPTIALKMCEIFSSAKVPSGVINIICGDNKRLVSALCKNSQVNAIWFTDVPPKSIYTNTSPNQRVFCCNNIWTDFNKAKILKCAIECTYVKTIFLPVGDIYAN